MGNPRLSGEYHYDDYNFLVMKITKGVDTKVTVYNAVSKEYTNVSVSSDVTRELVIINRKSRNQERAFRQYNDTFEDIPIDNSLSTTDETILDYICQKEEILLLYKAISTLTPEQQYLLRQIFWKERSISDVANEMGIVKSAVHKRKTKILEKLRKFFSEYGER